MKINFIDWLTDWNPSKRSASRACFRNSISLPPRCTKSTHRSLNRLPHFARQFCAHVLAYCSQQALLWNVLRVKKMSTVSSRLSATGPTADAGLTSALEVLYRRTNATKAQYYILLYHLGEKIYPRLLVRVSAYLFSLQTQHEQYVSTSKHQNISLLNLVSRKGLSSQLIVNIRPYGI